MNKRRFQNTVTGVEIDNEIKKKLYFRLTNTFAV